MPVAARHSVALDITHDRGFWVLFVSLFNNGVSNSMLFAILPALARDVGLADIAVGAIYVVAAFLFTIMSQVWGGLSDQYGRRPLIVMGLVGAALSMWAMAETVGLAMAGLIGAGLTGAMLIGSRAIFGLLNSAVAPAAQAWVADRTPPASRTRAIALLTSSFGAGAACGPIAAALLTPHLGYAGPFVVAGTVALVGAVLVRLTLSEDAPEPGRARRRLGDQWRLAGDPRLRHVLMTSALIWLVQAASLQTIGFAVMDRLGLSATDAIATSGVVLTAGALAALVAQLVVIPRLDLRPRAALVSGGGMAVLGAVVLAVAPSLALFVFGFVVLSLGIGLARPGAGAAASLAVSPHEQGATAGLIAATAGIGFFLSPALGVGLYTLAGGAGSFTALAVMGVLATIVSLRSSTIAAASARAGV